MEHIHDHRHFSRICQKPFEATIYMLARKAILNRMNQISLGIGPEGIGLGPQGWKKSEEGPHRRPTCRPNFF